MTRLNQVSLSTKSVEITSQSADASAFIKGKKYIDFFLIFYTKFVGA